MEFVKAIQIYTVTTKNTWTLKLQLQCKQVFALYITKYQKVALL